MTNESKRLKEARKALGLTQGELADALKCDQSYLSAIERGQRGVTSQIAKELFELYAISSDWLLNGIGQMIISVRMDVRMDVQTEQFMQKNRPYNGPVQEVASVEEPEHMYNVPGNGPPDTPQPPDSAIAARMDKLEGKVDAMVSMMGQLLAAANKP